YEKLGRAGEAMTQYELTRAEQRRVLGATHPETARTTIALAAVYAGMHRYADAEQLASEGYGPSKAAFGEANVLTQRAGQTLVTAYEGLGSRDAAAEWRARLIKP